MGSSPATPAISVDFSWKKSLAKELSLKTVLEVNFKTVFDYDKKLRILNTILVPFNSEIRV